MKNFKLVLTEMSPNGCNDLLVLNDYNEVVCSIEECVFGYPSNTAIQPDLSIDFNNAIGNAEVLNDPEMQEVGIQGLYSVTIEDVLKRIAVSPVNDGSSTVDKLKQLGLI